MTGLTDFLLARIAEDEAAARGAADHWGDLIAAYAYGATEAFGERHDPARVLAECEAKQRIVERAKATWADVFANNPLMDHPGQRVGEYSASEYRDLYGEEEPPWWLASDLRDLAAVYADHPDFQEEWRP